MGNGIILDSDDIRKIIAEKYHIDEKNVLKIQYSWVVRLHGEETE